MGARKVRETEIAVPVMDWAESMGWDCYPEAQFETGGRRADIAAVHGKLLWIIECKTSAGLQVLEQALNWRRRGEAHRVSVAVPDRRRSTGVFQQILRDYGIGLIFVRSVDPSHRKYVSPVEEHLAPRTLSKSDRLQALIDKNLEMLHPDMKHATPGQQASEQGWSTPYQRTMKSVISFIERNPGCTMKAAIDSINHHYSTDKSAIQSLSKWIQNHPEISIDRSARPFRFRYQDRED